MANSRLKGACYVVKLNDGNLLIEVDSFETYPFHIQPDSDRLHQFNRFYFDFFRYYHVVEVPNYAARDVLIRAPRRSAVKKAVVVTAK